MNKPAPQFRRIASPLDDVSDDDLNKLVDQLGVPSLVKPEPPPAHVIRPTPPAAAPIVIASRPQIEAQAPRQRDPLPVKEVAPTSVERISVDLPDYLGRAMRVRVAEEGTTMRFLVMQGLQAMGFRIDPADFVSDGRSGRAKAR